RQPRDQARTRRATSAALTQTHHQQQPQRAKTTSNTKETPSLGKNDLTNTNNTTSLKDNKNDHLLLHPRQRQKPSHRSRRTMSKRWRRPMQCTSPVRAYWPKDNAIDGRLVFDVRKAHPKKETLEIACGRCIGCRVNKAQQWATRMTL